jgi:hypothetical protein
MRFRLIVRLPGAGGGLGYSDCTRADDALAIYRRLSRTRLKIERILDLRSGREQQIGGPELEAITLRERRMCNQASVGNGGAS